MTCKLSAALWQGEGQQARQDEQNDCCAERVAYKHDGNLAEIRLQPADCAKITVQKKRVRACASDRQYGNADGAKARQVTT